MRVSLRMKVPYFYILQFLLVLGIIAYVIYPSEKELGVSFRKSYLIYKSLDMLEQALIKSPNSRVTLENLELIYEQMGLTSQQVDILKRLISLYPKLPEYKIKLDKIYTWMGNHEERVPIVEVLYHDHPEDSTYLDELKLLYEITNKKRSLAKLLEKQLRENPDQFYEFETLIFLYASLGQTDSLYNKYIELSRREPKNFDPVFHAISLLDPINDETKISELLNQYISRVKGIKGYHDVANYYSWVSEVEKEYLTLEKGILKYRKDSARFWDLANMAKERNFLSTAASYYQMDLDSNGLQEKSLLALAQVYGWLGLKNRELTTFQLLVDLNPKNLGFMDSLAIRYEWESDLSKLIELDRARLAIATHESDKYRLHMESAKHLEWANQPKSALIHYEWLALKTKDFEWDLKLFQIYDKENETEKWLNVTRRLAYELKDDRKLIYLQSLGEYYLYQNNNDSALFCFDQLSSLEPENPDWELKMADVYNWSHRPDSALVYWEKAYTKGARSPEVLQELAMNYFYRSNFEKSNFYFEQLNNSSSQSLSNERHYFLATGFDQLHNEEKATYHYQKYLTHLLHQKSFSETQLERLFQSAAYLKKNEIIVSFIKKIPPLNPLFEAYSPNVLYALFQQKRYTDATEFLIYYYSTKNRPTPYLYEIIDSQVQSFIYENEIELAIHFDSYLNPEGSYY